MTSVQSNDARVKDLVAKFTEIGIAQYRAAYVIDTARYNRLYKAMQRVRAELTRCPAISAEPCYPYWLTRTCKSNRWQRTLC